MTVAYPQPSSAAVSAVMRANKKADTKPEVRLRRALHARGLRFRKHLYLRASGIGVRPDLVFTRHRIAVFLDGCFWHRCPVHGNTPRANSAYWVPKLDGNVARDRRVASCLRADGWLVLRFWEHEPVADVAVAVEQAVRARSTLAGMPECTTARELAQAIWGSSEAHSRSWGARTVRRVARDLFAADAPGKGGDWRFTHSQAGAIRRDPRVAGQAPPGSRGRR